jgi:hypothetical protein
MGYAESCAFGLVFSKDLQTCDWPRQGDEPANEKLYIELNGQSHCKNFETQIFFLQLSCKIQFQWQFEILS